MKTLLLALLAASAGAEERWIPNSVYKFGGIDVYSDSAQIADGDAQDAENVLTDSGFLEKRPGNTRIAQILDGFSVKYLAAFTAPSSTRFLIAHASDTVYRTDLSSAGIVAISTIAVNYSVDSTVAFGVTIIVDGVQRAMTFDGQSTGTIAGMPICSLTEFFNERVVCGNIPDESSSRVRLSSAGDRTGWVIPSNVATVDDAPNGFDFSRNDGEAITCLKTTPWGLVVGKRHSMHILKGIANTTFYKKIVDPVIGCVDDRSMQMVDGFLIWLGVDAVYSWNGSSPPQVISRDVESIIKGIRQLNSVQAQWTVDSESEWEAGTITGNGPANSWDSNSISGTIFPTSSTFVDTFNNDFNPGTFNGPLSTNSVQHQVSMSSAQFVIENGDAELGTLNRWTCATNSGSCSCSVAAGNAINGTYGLKNEASCGGTGTSGAIVSIMREDNTVLQQRFFSSSASVLSGDTIDLSGYASTQSIRIRFNSFTQTSDCDLTSTTFTAISSISWTAVAGGNCPGGNFGWNKLDDVKVNRYFSHYQSSAVHYSVSRVFDLGFSTAIGGPLTVSSSVPAGTSLAFQVRSATAASSGPFTNLTTFTNGERLTTSGRYQQYVSSYTTAVGTSAPIAYDFNLPFVSSGTYYSEVHFIGNNISTWRTSDWTDTQTPSGILLYSVRSATWSFSPTDNGANTPAWTSQTNHQTIRISTGSYFQFRVESSSVTSSSQTYSIARFAANWQEGSEKPVASGTIDHRYYLCAIYSTTTVNSDACMVLQKNNKWTKFTGPSISAMTLYDNNLVAGDGGTNSYVWKTMQDGVYRDDTSAISAFWTTKDYTNGDPFREKVMYEMWVDAEVASSTMSVAYAANKGTTFTSKNVPLNLSTNYVNKRVPWDAGFVLGKYHRFRFSNSTVDQYFRLNGYLFYSETKGRTTD